MLLTVTATDSATDDDDDDDDDDGGGVVWTAMTVVHITRTRHRQPQRRVLPARRW